MLIIFSKDRLKVKQSLDFVEKLINYVPPDEVSSLEEKSDSSAPANNSQTRIAFQLLRDSGRETSIWFEIMVCFYNVIFVLIGFFESGRIATQSNWRS